MQLVWLIKEKCDLNLSHHCLKFDAYRSCESGDLTFLLGQEFSIDQIGHAHCKKYRDWPGTMRRLCLSIKFPHQEIRWNHGIFRSGQLVSGVSHSKTPPYHVWWLHVLWQWKYNVLNLPLEVRVTKFTCRCRLWKITFENCTEKRTTRFHIFVAINNAEIIIATLIPINLVTNSLLSLLRPSEEIKSKNQIWISFVVWQQEICLFFVCNKSRSAWKSYQIQ